MTRREVLDLADVPHHGAPIPQAVRIGNMVFSSAIAGSDQGTGKAPTEPAEQVRLAFAHMRRIVEAAGGGTANIAKLTVFLRDMQHRELVNVEWLRMFPDEHDRPVRHALKADLPGNLVVQLEFIAVL